MNQISTKLLTTIAIFLFVAIIPIAVFAANENVSVVSEINNESKIEYIIYIKDYTDQNFKYAFTTNANPEEMDLSYINSISDLGENQVAFLDIATYEELSEQSSTIYMWAKDESENLILNGIQLDLNQALSEEEIDNVETLTKRIEVKIAETQEDATTVRNENIDGVDEVANVGYVEILDDDKKATYYYERTKLPDAEKYNQLMVLAEKINNEYDEMDMYEKVQFGTEFNELYSKVINEAKEGKGNKKYKLVFDSASRMSRDSEGGCALYEDLFNHNVSIEFLKEPHINTEVYRKALENQIQLQVKTGNTATDELVNSIIEALNKYTLELAKEQIRKVFEQAQKELEDLHVRTSEGLETAKLEGKRVGTPKGTKLETKKSIEAKALIIKYSKDFNGVLSDVECIKLIGICRNSYYTYKKKLKEN